MKPFLICTAVLSLALVLAWGAMNPSPAAATAAAGADTDPADTDPTWIVIFCPVHQGCEVDAQCHKKNNTCTLTFDTGDNSCRLSPGESFDCPPGETVHVETCDCSGKGCTMSTGTYLTCA